MKTEIPISPVDLYRKFAGTDSKALVSFQAITALNIHLGGDENISKKALNEYLRNLTFQGLSKENNSIFMSYEDMGNLALDILESLARIENQLVDGSNILSESLKQQLDQANEEYKLDLPPELKIQKNISKYKKGGKELPPEPVSSSTPLKTEEINEIYDKEKENYLKTAVTYNQVDIMPKLKQQRKVTKMQLTK